MALEAGFVTPFKTGPKHPQKPLFIHFSKSLFLNDFRQGTVETLNITNTAPGNEGIKLNKFEVKPAQKTGYF